MLVARDGSLFVESFVPGHRHELQWHPRSGVTGPEVVQTFDSRDSKSQVLGAAFDGRYLVYSLLHSDRTFDDWTLHVWDARVGGDPLEVGRSERDGSGQPLPGPLNYPLVLDGRLVWVQTRDAETRQTVIYAYDIEQARRVPLRAGHPGRPLLMGDQLIWPESPAPDTATRLHAVDFRTGEPVHLPEHLASIVGPAFLATSDDTFAWSSTDMTELWVWRRSWRTPMHAVPADPGDALQSLHVAGDVITFDSGSEQWALDLRSGGYAQLTQQAGAQDTGGSWLWLMHGTEKSPDGRAELGAETVVDTAALPPLPSCPRPSTTP